MNVSLTWNISETFFSALSFSRSLRAYFENLSLPLKRMYMSGYIKGERKYEPP
jgi:hypothetical protein